MKMILKRSLSITLLATLFVTTMPLPSMAQAIEEHNYLQQSIIVQPRLKYIAQTMNAFAINNGVAEVECWVAGDVLDATKAKVIAELQVKNGSSWIPVKIWTDTQNGYEASVYETYDVNPNNTYRVKATFYVWEGSQSESLITISDEQP